MATGDATDAYKPATAALVADLIEKFGPPQAIGISSPGLAARDHRSSAWMRGRMARVEGYDWRSQLGREVWVPNDAHAALMGETWIGAAAQARNAVMLTLGTGVGGAILCVGRLLRGTPMHPAVLHSRLPVLADVDLLVVGGGGSAGCCAAISAAESDAGRVMLVERYGFPGGSSTGVLHTFSGFFTPGDQPRKVVGGLSDRVVDVLAATDSMYLRPNTYGAGTGVTYNPERLKCVWDRLLAAAGVDVLCHAMLVDTETDSAGRLRSAVIASNSGAAASPPAARRITARRFIDASGDADLCHWAGVAYEAAGDIDPAQTLTSTFRLGTGCVDIPAVISELKAIGYTGVLRWEDEPEDRHPLEIAAEMREYILQHWSKP